MWEATIEVKGKFIHVYNRSSSVYVDCWIYENGANVSFSIGCIIREFEKAQELLKDLKHSRNQIQRSIITGVTQ